jgi:hypothetical protein
VDRSSLEGDSGRDAMAPGLNRMAPDEIDEFGGHVIEGRPVVRVAVSPHDDATAGRAQPGRVLDEGVEDWLKIERRATNDLQNLSGRRLLLEGFGQVLVASLQFLEQPHVLDRDDRLVGEGLEKLHVRVGKSTRLPSGHPDGSHGLGPPQHGDRE